MHDPRVLVDLAEQVLAIDQLKRAPPERWECEAETFELAIRSLSGPADMRARCDLEATGDGATELRLAASIELKGFLRFAEGQARKILDREMPTAMTDLARHIEAG